MQTKWKEYLPYICTGFGFPMVGWAAWTCTKLTRGTGGDHIFVGLTLVAIALLAVALVWLETRDIERTMALLLPIGAAVLVRALCMDNASEDYNNFLHHLY